MFGPILGGGGGSGGEGILEVQFLVEVLPLLRHFVVEAAELSYLSSPATLVFTIKLGQAQHVIIVGVVFDG